jgi:hypothetical protein
MMRFVILPAIKKSAVRLSDKQIDKGYAQCQHSVSYGS